jgi:hypothetical protein
MPKKRKTRNQKISSEKKRQIDHETVVSVDSSSSKTTQSTQQETATQEVTFSLPTNYHATQTTQKEKKITSSVTTSISTSEYGYLGKDLMRTALLSGAIVIAELLIRLFYTH